MKNHLSLLTILLASTTFGFPAWGQTIYKCGTVYSQQPCSGAVTFDASDSRTPAQKAQADTAAADAAKAASKMEKDRLALEKTQAAKPAKKPAHTSQTAKADSTGAAAKPGVKQKKKEPEYFTAAVAPEKKEKKAARKPDDKTQIAKVDKTDQPVKP